ncbi:MAG: Ig-like domain-containing protein [Coxiellaceae bacterium]|nr:Ig-like domain-containing protein [Coxiellaceae bacterium]
MKTHCAVSSRFYRYFIAGLLCLFMLLFSTMARASLSDFAATFRNNTNHDITLKSMRTKDNPLTLVVPRGETIAVPKSGWVNAGDKHVYIELVGDNKQLCTKDPNIRYGTKFSVGFGWDVKGDLCPSADLQPPTPPLPPVEGVPIFSSMPDLIQVTVGQSVSYSGMVSNTSGSTDGITVVFSPNSVGGISASYGGNGVVMFSGVGLTPGSHVIQSTATNNQGSSTYSTTVQVSQSQTSAIVPRTISAWLYDASGPSAHLGQFEGDIRKWNEKAKNAGDKLIELHTYGTDMEMYGEAPNYALETYYTLPTRFTINGENDKSQLVGPYNLLHYKQAIPELAYMSPTVDGRTDAGGYLTKFNTLSLGAVLDYADLLSSQACMDRRLDGLQIDVEPLDFSITNGENTNVPTQVAFYLRISDNFSAIAKDPAIPSRIGPEERATLAMCKDKHRYVSVFTFASKIQSAVLNQNLPASDATQELLKRENFLVVDSLYDLPPGTTSKQMTDPATYYWYVKEEAQAMLDLSNRYKFNFKFAIPASCSFHECGTTSGGKYKQKDYALAAINAIGAVNAENNNAICNSPYFKGVAVWAFDYHEAKWDGQNFSIIPPTNEVMDALLHHGHGNINGQAVIDNRPVKTGISNAIGCSINQ